MTIKELTLKLNNLEKNVMALASRKYGERAEEAKSEALRVDSKADNINNEVLESAITMADFMEEYYMSQFE